MPIGPGQSGQAPIGPPGSLVPIGPVTVTGGSGPPPPSQFKLDLFALSDLRNLLKL